MRLATFANYLGVDSHGFNEIHFNEVKIDSRKVNPGDLFVAFKGLQVDGHDYAMAAVENGAIAILAQKPLPTISVPVIVVSDCFAALTHAAQEYRKTWNTKVLALTGSNGKTTVKEMIALILPSPRFATQGNFNNELGVPINILNVKPECKFAIFELGANHKGDIAYTAELVKPDISLINNIGPAHLGGFGSIEGVAIAKGEIYQALPQEGIAIINDDDQYAHYWDNIIASRLVFRFSSSHPTDVWADSIEVDEWGSYSFNLHAETERVSVKLKVPGRHQVQNALAAASMCYAAGLSLQSIAQGLASFTGVKGRLNILTGFHEAKIIDDTYNANLESIRAGLQYLASCSGKKILVIGDLAELGEFSVDQHKQIGIIAKELKIDELLAIGQYTTHSVSAFGKDAIHFEDREHLVNYLKKILNQQTNVLIKGSRSSRMEEIVHKILN